jgi:hypothetical protein
MRQCVIMLKHEVMAVPVSLSIQIVIDKMQMCLFSVDYACSYHNPTATMGHSVHNGWTYCQIL